MTVWTVERVDRLASLWKQGWSCSQIAADLGNGISRNAVIGKIHRLGMSQKRDVGPVKNAAWPPKPARRSPANVKPRPIKEATQKPAPQFSAIPLPPEVPAPDPLANVSILGLTSRTCRWPVGDPRDDAFAYCGAAKEPEVGPYCSFHFKLAYQPGTRKRSPMSAEQKAKIRDALRRKSAEQRAAMVAQWECAA